ncbi:MAG TPA: hypothetical protein PK079_21615 [Leptospiraceae bacterium]|nr:hypothetical protein [Leptospiraceae bacterium]HMW08105.1 hypothetical protein [Leptospiraceae bacterium]HMY33816.1 hypothetical protein [Leptospiraceae bacterium]HMZ65927.1 hypothetical protein [Leptospiraceae bacterium]HNA08851.1 hypothetical protein [Leptospiraceae bacterium]
MNENDKDIIRVVKIFDMRTGKIKEIIHFQINKKYFLKRKGKIRECIILEFFSKEKHSKAKIIFSDTQKLGEAFLDELHESPENT